MKRPTDILSVELLRTSRHVQALLTYFLQFKLARHYLIHLLHSTMASNKENETPPTPQTDNQTMLRLWNAYFMLF